MAFPIAAAAMFGMNIASNIYQNQTQKEIADETNAMNRQLSREQMEFQERMSNTAHRREVEDLRAAGMNPILTATGGAGASTPGGSSATMIAPDFTSPLKGAGEAALGAMQTIQSMKNTEADTAQKVENAKLLADQRASTAKDVERKGIDNEFQRGILGQQIKKGELDIGRGNAELRKAGVDANVSERTAIARMQQIRNEALISGSKVQSAKDAAAYDYAQERDLDSIGMGSSSAKPQDNDSAGMKLKHGAYKLHNLFMRRLFRGGGK